MKPTVCITALTIAYPQGGGGGHQWVYLNWALGLQALGCGVVWLEVVKEGDLNRLPAQLTRLEERLRRYGLDRSIALVLNTGEPLPPDSAPPTVRLEEAVNADLLVNLWYQMPAKLVAQFRRSALLDIDPGLLQGWMQRWQGMVAPHDVYFTTGETVGMPGSRIADVGITWHHTVPCVALDWWPVTPASSGAAYTTVSHWQMGEYEYDGDEIYANDKRTGFLPFRELPQFAEVPLELALFLSDDDAGEAADWKQAGWRIRDSAEVASTPWDYRTYIQSSRGEFSAVKPSCVRLQNAWISDRTLCYLASGKPAVVEYTGPSNRLPDTGGLFRFRNAEEAIRAFTEIEADYDEHCRLARRLAETHFDAAKVSSSLIETALT